MAVTVGASAPTQAQQKAFQSAFSVSPDFAARGREVLFGFAGDSIAGMWASSVGDSPITWAASELYPCAIRRHFSSAVGGTSSSHLLTTQLAQLQGLTIKPDVLVVQTLQNDFMNSTASADGWLSNVTSYVTQALAAGVKQVWVCSRPPKSESNAGVPYAITYANRKLREFCRQTPGCVYIDVFNLWRSINLATATTQITWKGTAGTPTEFSNDGTHPTPYAARAVAATIADLLRGIAPPISPFEASLSGYDNSTGIWNNLLGPNGQMLGTLGRLNGVNNTGVAGTEANDQNRWNITTSNGVTVTPSIVTGADGFQYQQLDLGGTATADTQITCSITPATNLSGTWVREAIVEVENINAVRYVEFYSSFGAASTGTASSGPTQSELPAGLTSRFHFRTDPFDLTITNFAGNSHILRIGVRNGQSPTGKVRLGRCGTYRIA